jgi:hypothetical protein
MVIGAVGWLLQQGQGAAEDGFGLTDVAAIASIVISGLALVISIRNRSTAIRALDLSERQEARRLIPFEVYLAEALRWPRADGTVLHGTSVRLSNPADRPAAIVAAELRAAKAAGRTPRYTGS